MTSVRLSWMIHVLRDLTPPSLLLYILTFPPLVLAIASFNQEMMRHLCLQPKTTVMVKGFSFMTKGSQAILCPVCFGARKTNGNEARLHSHLGEGFLGD